MTQRPSDPVRALEVSLSQNRQVIFGQSLIRSDFITREVAEFLRATVTARLNIIVCGNARAGKTTLLNILANWCDPDERIITVEKIPELQLELPHAVALTPQVIIEEKGSVTFRDVLLNALRMHPGRIIVSDVQGEEILDLLDIMNTSPSGAISTVNVSGSKGMIAWLEFVAARAGLSLSPWVIRKQLTSLIHLIVHVTRLRDGSRKVMSVAEIRGLSASSVALQDLFVFQQTGFDRHGIVGRLNPTGFRPKCIDQIEDAGIFLPPSVFGPPKHN